MSDPKTISFKLIKFEVDSIKLEAPKEKFDFNTLVFNISLAWHTKVDDGQMPFTLTIQVLHEGKEVVSIKTTTYFLIDDLKTYVNSKTNALNISNDVLGTFVSIAYSTTRGILFEKLAGSTLSGLILPLIDPKALIDHTKKGSQDKKHA